MIIMFKAIPVTPTSRRWSLSCSFPIVQPKGERDLLRISAAVVAVSEAAADLVVAASAVVVQAGVGKTSRDLLKVIVITLSKEGDQVHQQA